MYLCMSIDWRSGECKGACRDHKVFVNKDSGMCDASYSPTRKVTIVEILCLSFYDS